MREEKPAWEIGENDLLGDSDFGDKKPDQVETSGSPTAPASDRKALPESDNSQKSAKKRSYSSPPPPPVWEIDDETFLSEYSSFHSQPSSLKGSSFRENVTIEIDNVSFTWDGQGWCDEQRVSPPKLIISQLNDKLMSHLAAEDDKITNVKILLIRARQARENLQYERAEMLARKAIELDPENHAGAAVLCATLRARGRPLEAIEQTNRFIFSKHTPFLTSRAAAYCDLRMWEQAKKTIGKALSIEESEEAYMVVKRIKAARPEIYTKGEE